MTRANSAQRPSSSVLFQPLDDGGVLFCTTGETYFGLNAVGVEIWKLITESEADSEAVVQRLRSRYPDTPVETLRGDVGGFLAELASAGLLAA